MFIVPHNYHQKNGLKAPFGAVQEANRDVNKSDILSAFEMKNDLHNYTFHVFQ